MTALDFIRYANDVVYLLLFVFVAAQAARRRTAVAIDTAIFFGALVLAVSEGLLAQLFGFRDQRILSAAASIAILALPFLLLRLVDDFMGVPRVVMVVAGVGLLVSALAVILIAPLPLEVTLAVVAYFAFFTLYAAVAFARAARTARGVNRRRLQSISLGSLVLGTLILVAGGAVAFPAYADPLNILVQVLALIWGLSYAAGFAPPRWLRRLWQEPELRGFLADAARLPRLGSTADVVQGLEVAASETLGTPVQIAIADAAGTMYFRQTRSAEPFPVAAGSTLPARRAFDEQRTLFYADLARDDPANIETYRGRAVRSAILAPVTAGERRLGVLMATAARAPLFAEDDVALAKLIADQAAVILESRALIDEASEMRARERATRLKEDFLSAAAHDLKTPLTTLVAQTAYLEHRARREPAGSPDPEALGRITREARRLRDLVEELLDASRLEAGTFTVRRETADLVALAGDVAARPRPGRHHVRVDADGPLVGSFDGVRITQLLENLVDNAAKYSDPAHDIEIRLRRASSDARIDVLDSGIGIPPEDLPHVFERFHRGGNVDDRRHAGMGLGLYISRAIVEQHGGTIAVESQPGAGTIVRVSLPLVSGTA